MFVPTMRRPSAGRPSADAPVSVVESEYSDPFEYSCRHPSRETLSAPGYGGPSVSQSSVNSHLAPPSHPLPPSHSYPSLPYSLPVSLPPSQLSLPPSLPPLSPSQLSVPASSRPSLPPPPRSLDISRPLPRSLPVLSASVTDETDLNLDKERYLRPRDAPPRPLTRPFSWGLDNVALLPSVVPRAPTLVSPTSQESAPSSNAISSLNHSYGPVTVPGVSRHSSAWFPGWVTPRSSWLLPRRGRISEPPKACTAPSSPVKSLRTAKSASTAPPPPSSLQTPTAHVRSKPASHRSTPTPTSHTSFSPHINANANTDSASLSESDRRIAAWLGASSSACTASKLPWEGSTDEQHGSERERTMERLVGVAESHPLPMVQRRTRTKPSIYDVFDSPDLDSVGSWPTPPPRQLPPMRAPPRTKPPPPPITSPHPSLQLKNNPSGSVSTPTTPCFAGPRPPTPTIPLPQAPSRVYNYPAVASHPLSPPPAPPPLPPPVKMWWRNSFPASVSFSSNTPSGRTGWRRPRAAASDEEKHNHPAATAQARPSLLWKEYPEPAAIPRNTSRWAGVWAILVAAMVYLVALFSHQRSAHAVPSDSEHAVAMVNDDESDVRSLAVEEIVAVGMTNGVSGLHKGRHVHL